MPKILHAFLRKTPKRYHVNMHKYAISYGKMHKNL